MAGGGIDLRALAILSGTPGAFAGRDVFRRKTHKQPSISNLLTIAVRQLWGRRTDRLVIDRVTTCPFPPHSFIAIYNSASPAPLCAASLPNPASLLLTSPVIRTGPWARGVHCRRMPHA